MVTRKTHTLRKREKIKSRKLTEQLFKSASSFIYSPFKVIYSAEKGSGIQAGFAVGTRHFKKATLRNRVKRLMRESFRTQKAPIVERSKQNQIRTAVFFVYIRSEIPQLNEMKDKMKGALEKLQRFVYETNSLHS
jgi:ribonuclease P protein component